MEKSKCALCGKARLASADPWICDACHRTLPIVHRKIPCTPMLDGCIAPFYYRDAVRRAILRFKFQHAVGKGRYFGEKMAECYQLQADAWQIDCITYVPISLPRWWKRGYNQSKVLAQMVAKHTDCPIKPLLRRRFFSHKQSAQKDYHARQLNTAHAFYLPSHCNVVGKRVLLIDDIYTTGATANACAAQLKQSGAACVYLLCAAYTDT